MVDVAGLSSALSKLMFSIDRRERGRDGWIGKDPESVTDSERNLIS